MTRLLLLTSAALLPSPAIAQPGADDEIIVTGRRAGDGTPRALTGSSVTALDAPTIEARQTRLLSDILRDVPGVAVSRAGGLGGSTQVRLRGAEANHTLVLVDGIEVADPFQGETDFATLLTDPQARVEVLRGPQSAIYGSDAIGGVVQLITASGADAPGVSGRIEGGSFDTVAGAARIGALAGALDYAISGSAYLTGGTPSARRGIGDRDLSADNRSLSAKLGLAATDTLRLTAVGRYSRTEADTNPQDFDFTSPTYGFVVDGDDDYETRTLSGLIRADLTTGRVRHALSGQLNDTHRANRTADVATFTTRGRKLKAAYDATIAFGDERIGHDLTLAADYEHDRFRNVALGVPGPSNDVRTTDMLGLVADYGLRLSDAAALGLAVRHDINDRFDDATTVRARGTVAVAPAFRLRAAAGTGIKNPTNFELFGFDPSSFIGNPALKPERSFGWEVGVDAGFADDRVRLSATYFDSRLDDEIFTAFSPTFVASPENRDTRSTQRGVELAATAVLGGGWRADLAYTYTDARENDVEELRRPPHIGSAAIAWRARDDRAGATLVARYNGETLDSNFTNLPIGPLARLDDYVLVTLAGDVAVTDALSLFGRVENLLDEDYEDVFTYRSPGRSVVIGVRARL